MNIIIIIVIISIIFIRGVITGDKQWSILAYSILQSWSSLKFYCSNVFLDHRWIVVGVADTNKWATSNKYTAPQKTSLP